MEQDISGGMQDLQAIALDYSLDLVGAIVILVVGWIVAGWIKVAVAKTLSRFPNADATVTKALSGLARYLILVLVLIAVLAEFGVQTASILAVLGTAGLAIGLAMQGTLSNIAAGFMLLMLRPFKIGDYIDAEGIAGTVEGIGLFTTEFTTFDGVYLVVPNGQIWSRSIANYSRLPTRRLDVPIGIAYDDDIDKAIGELMALLEGDERVLEDPAPQVMVKELADSSVNLNVRCWANADDYWALLFDLNKAAKERVEAAGCTIPFPQRDVHMIAAAPAAESTA
jgi:small conductance mechanosensitive channel